MQAYLPNLQRPMFPQNGLPPHLSNISPPTYPYHQTTVNNHHNRYPIQQTFTGANLHVRHENKNNQTVNNDINSTTGPHSTITVNHPQTFVITSPTTENSRRLDKNATSNLVTPPNILTSTDTTERLNKVNDIKESQQELQTEPEQVYLTVHNEQVSTNKVKKSTSDKEAPNVESNQISQEVIRPISNTEDYPTNQPDSFLGLCQNIQRIT
ncbi:unnamed protein product [Mytilus coruscus]|uniref:Uncharacterized protein n=1 Tax=Mytilus coruscus TaxID=42192 RepID=A0A6J8DQI6_MYTCO|nr:unnamed protein product [Mytilus coruscus]